MVITIDIVAHLINAKRMIEIQTKLLYKTKLGFGIIIHSEFNYLCLCFAQT